MYLWCDIWALFKNFAGFFIKLKDCSKFEKRVIINGKLPPSKNLPIANIFFRFCFMVTLRKDPSISCVNLISWNFRGGGGLDPRVYNSCIQFSKMNTEPRLYQFSILILKNKQDIFDVKYSQKPKNHLHYQLWNNSHSHILHEQLSAENCRKMI